MSRTEVDSDSRAEDLRQKILDLVAEYHEVAFRPRPFVAGETPVPVSGRFFDAVDVQYLVDASLDFWLTAGRFAVQFERHFARAVKNIAVAKHGAPDAIPGRRVIVCARSGRERENQCETEHRDG